MAAVERRPAQILALLQRYQGFAGLVLLLFVALLLEPRFFGGENLANVLNQLAIPGTLALGMTFVILTGGIDLSVGSLFGLLNCVTASMCLQDRGLPATASVVLALGTGIGALTGLVVARSGLQPFVVTLAGMVTLRGAAFMYTDSKNISGIGDALSRLQGGWQGLPIQAWVFIAATLIAAIALAKTRFGRHVYAVGGNIEASRLSGVPVDGTRIAAYAINGLCVSLAALMFTAKTNNGQPSAGIGYELDAIAATVVGGCSLLGGYGSAIGTFVGALFIVCVTVLLILRGVNYQVGLGMKGIIILVAVYIQSIGRR
jgi:ribose transport system permease protein